MSKKILLIAAIIIILFFVVVAFYSQKKTNKINYPENREQIIKDLITKPAETINVKHQYKDGTHYFAGVLEVPTPCHEHSVQVIKKDYGAEIAITITNSLNSDRVCAQMIEERQFKISFTGNENDEIDATINGELVNLNIFEIGSDENINDLEFFFKG